jgi:hypothetical protein
MSEINSGDRRSFFRVSDHVLLDYRRLAPGEDLHRPPPRDLGSVDAFAMCNHLGSLSQRLRPALSRLRCRQPELAEVLAALDDKIEAVAASVLAHQLGDLGSCTRRVSLSAGGLAFHATEALATQCALELRLVLLPSFNVVHARARVERCNREPDFRDGFPYRIAVAFRGMREEQRSLIVKHALARQAAERRG